jgi:hypothetical protein
MDRFIIVRYVHLSKGVPNADWGKSKQAATDEPQSDETETEAWNQTVDPRALKEQEHDQISTLKCKNIQNIKRDARQMQWNK